MVQGVPGFFEHSCGKPKRRSRQTIQRGFGFRAIQMPGGGGPKHSTKRAMNFNAERGGQHAGGGVIGQEPVGAELANERESC